MGYSSHTARTHAAKKPSAFLFFLLSALGRFCGFLRTARLAAAWGLSASAAVYDFSFSLIGALYDCTFGALITFFAVPFLLEGRRSQTERFPDRAFLFPRGFSRPALLLFSAVLLFFLLLLPGLFFFLPTLAPALADRPEDVISVCALFSLDHAFTALYALLSAGFQVGASPLRPALIGALTSFFLTAVLFPTAPALSPAGVALLLLLTNALSFLLLWPATKRLSLPKTPALLPHPAGQTTAAQLGRALPAILALAAFQPLSTLILSHTAALFSPSAMAACGYARKLIFLAAALFFATAHALWYPSMAACGGASEASARPTALLAFFSALGTLVLLALLPLLTALFFPTESADMRSELVRLFALFALSLPPLALLPFLSELAFLRGRVIALLPVLFLSLAVQLFSLAYLPAAFGLFRLPLSLASASYTHLLLSLFFLHLPPRFAPLKRWERGKERSSP